MTLETAMKIVKDKYPDARYSSTDINNVETHYVWLYDEKDRYFFSHTSELNAWINAAEQILNETK